MRKYSILSLSLLTVSAIAAAFIPKAAEADAQDFVIQPSTTAEGALDLTCAPGVGGEACTYTATTVGDALNLSSTSDNVAPNDNSDTAGGDEASGTGTTGA